MTEAGIDKLTDELIDAKYDLDAAYAKINEMIDNYDAVAEALGCTSFFHPYVLARAKELSSFARVA